MKKKFKLMDLDCANCCNCQLYDAETDSGCR